MAIPEPKQPIKTDTITQIYPGYAWQQERFRFLFDTYTGGGGYQYSTQRYNALTKTPIDGRKPQKTYLEPHTSESAEKFERRVTRAVYPNWARRRIVQPLTGFLTKRAPSRDLYPEEITAWMDSVTKDGQGWDLWLKNELVPWGLAYGHMFAISDSDAANALTMAQRREQGAKEAQMALIHPQTVLDFWRDDTGKVRWLKKVERVVGHPDPLAAKKLIDRVRYYTEEGWWIVDLPAGILNQDAITNREKEYPVVASGAWPSGLGLPISEFRIGKEGLSAIEDIAPVSRRLFNAISERNEISRGQTFAILTIPTSGGQALDEIIAGTDSGLSFDPEAKHKPFYLTPDRGPLDQYADEIRELPAQMIELANLDFSGGQATAAAAKAFQFQGTDRLLSDLAGDLARFEYETMQIVAKWLGTEWDANAKVSYPDTFDAVDTERYLNAAVIAKSLGIGPTFDRLCKKRVAAIMIPNMSDDNQKAIDKELEAQPARPTEPTNNEPPGSMEGETIRDMAPSPIAVPEGRTR